jgi:hypothetical protein
MPCSPGSPTVPRRSLLGAWIAVALLLAGCAVEGSLAPSTGATGGGGGASGAQSLLPGAANADYTVTIDHGDTTATFEAQYYQGASPLTGTSIGFSDGESVSVDGTPLDEESFAGVFYGGEGPLVDPGQPYTFVLSVPGKGSFSTPVVMVGPASVTAPVEGATLSSATALTVVWSVSEAGTVDEVDAAFEPNGDGELATATATAPAGVTQVTFSATELQALYAQAVGSAGGSAIGTLTLKRSRLGATGAPFLGGQLQLSSEIDQVSVKLTK